MFFFFTVYDFCTALKSLLYYKSCYNNETSYYEDLTQAENFSEFIQNII